MKFEIVEKAADDLLKVWLEIDPDGDVAVRVSDGRTTGIVLWLKQTGTAFLGDVGEVRGLKKNRAGEIVFD